MDPINKKLLVERHHMYAMVNNAVEPVWDVQARQARELERWILTKDPADTKTAAEPFPTKKAASQKPTPIKKAAREGDPAEKPTPTKKAKPNTQP